MRVTAMKRAFAPTLLALAFLASLVAVIVVPAAGAYAATNSADHGSSGSHSESVRYSAAPNNGPRLPERDQQKKLEEAKRRMNSDGWGKQNLPVNRWSDATTDLHSRLGGGLDLSKLNSTAQREIISQGALSWGNLMFKAATGMTQGAVEFSMLNKVSYQIDHTVAKLGKAMLNGSPVIVVFVALILISIFWSAARQGDGGPIRAIFKPLIIIGVFGVLVFGATASTKATPGTGSPVWVAKKTNTVVSAVASAPTTALTSFGVDASLNLPKKDLKDPLSCATSLKNMKDEYKDYSGSKLGKLSRSMPLSLSNMWEATGLKLWKQAQFGYGDKYSHYMFCRQLDQNAHISPSDQFRYVDSSEADQSNKHSLAWDTVSNDSVDVSMMYWAACRFPDGKWQTVKAWTKINKGTNINCRDWYENDVKGRPDSKGNTFDAEKSPLNFTGSQEDILNKKIGSRDGPVANFVMAYQGWDNTSTTTSSIAYAISGTVLGVTMILVAILVYGAKIAMVVMLVMVLFALLLELIPGVGGKLGRFVGAYFGTVFIAFGFSLIFALIMLFTGMIISLGSGASGGAASFLAMVWTGLAPAFAVALIHIVFVKFLKLPSPVTPTGMAAWAGGASATGAGVQNGLKQFGQRGREALSGKKPGQNRDGADRDNSKLTPTSASQGGNAAANDRRQKMPPAAPNDHDAASKSGSRQGMPTKDAAAEAKSAKQFAKQGKKDAKQAGKLHAKNQIEEMGAGRYYGGQALSSAGSAAASLGGKAWSSLHDNGIRSSAGAVGMGLAKGAGFGAAMVGATAIGGLPGAAAVGAGLLGGKPAARWVRSTISPEAHREKRAQQIEAYRSHRENIPTPDNIPAKPDVAPASAVRVNSAANAPAQGSHPTAQPAPAAPQAPAPRRHQADDGRRQQPERQQSRPQPQQKVPRPNKAGGGKPNPQSQPPSGPDSRR